MLMPPESINGQTGYMLTIVLTDQDTAESTTAVYSQFYHGDIGARMLTTGNQQVKWRSCNNLLA
jgi:hypothetical protein